MSEQPNTFEDPALLIVDMQNDFVRQDAPLQVPDALATVAAHQALIAAFRAQDLPVVYTKFLATQTPSLLWNWSPQCEPPTKCCWKGHQRHYPDVDAELDCTGIIDELAPEAEDLIIEKYGYGAFHGTALNDSLRNLGVGSLVITGTVTQICVEETAREAFHHRFPTIVVSDAVSSFDEDLQAATLRNFAMKFGWVQSSTEVIEALG
ncbi:MAG: cysteine hydrolase [Rhodospirillaceae bacterium]|jgi:nicotinamidase-related amidase|nr:cysteine hydrolase [Rhodospirillaceae bacterium]MBT3494625.1 cysteine hydrolase [Rhodospirillaceae bacterium]MBT3780885.1 cysteine hydrolase [Rhodospirillaceae bacterium]MBT3978914.1 cysteine hydrolase [Rhodospirillaceae bacterium]MBT4562866.1 cysteine hydrolase [Rhodospirillaceae bacterium]